MFQKKNMKYLVMLALLCGSALYAQNVDTLVWIGETPVMMEEYRYITEKNKNSKVASEQTLEETFDMFVNYKLKVIEAKAQGLDTVETFLNEFNGYRNQLAQPYLTDRDYQEQLYRQAYEHLKTDVEVSHVLISIDKNDTLAAYKKAMIAYSRLMNNEEMAVVATEMSDDQSVKSNKGYLGFFTGLNTVWEFEKAMFALPVGAVSKPVRTNYGYHVIKVHSRRAAKGRVNASHIMKLSNPSMSEEEKAQAEKDINDIYNRLMNGGSFEDIAMEESDDKGSARKGGSLSWFGIGRMVKPFEDAAFALEVGEISKPIRTQFGWHIIKLRDKKGIEPYENMKEPIRRSMQNDSRSTASYKSFMRKLKVEYKLYQNKHVLNDITKLMKENKGKDSVVLAKSGDFKEVIVAFKENVIPASDFIEYCVDMKVNVRGLYEALDKFSEKELLRYENSQLEKKYPEFRFLMQEYYDGLLLFEVSNKEVWMKTSTDKKGLKKYFRKNLEEYAWDSPRYKGVIVKASSEEVAKIVFKKYEKLSVDSLEKHVKKVAGEDAKFMIDRGIWKKGDNVVVDELVFEKKDVSSQVDSVYTVIEVKGRVQKKYPSSYLDVRGKVTSDYQFYLENRWINKLRRKYPLRYNDDAMREILNP